MKTTEKRRDSQKNLNLQKTLVLNLRTASFTSRPFKDVDINRCVDMLIYGTSIQKITKGGGGMPHYVFFYIFEDDLTQLQWISNHKPLRDSRIDLKNVTSISEIPTVAKKKKIDKYDPSLLLSIHCGVNEELLLLFDDETKKKDWWCGLQYFVEKAQIAQGNEKVSSNALARDIFARADADGTKTLNKQEIRQIFKDMQIYMKNKKVNDIIDKYDFNKNGMIDFGEFQELVKMLLRKDELIPLFKKYTVGWLTEDYDSPTMTLIQLLRFFQEEQKQELTIEEVRKFNDTFADVSPAKPCISFDQFCDLIFSMLNTIFNPERSIEFQDMGRPLTDYYINTSHNTYLMANQLTGESSVHAYINALLKGCRCVELDLWNGPNAEPIIYHGHTMTSKISFRDVIVALKEHAFKKNPYPLIMSFEMHCDLRAQHKVVDILHSEIGDMIYVIPDDFKSYEYYPSPESLKNKFIIKGKGKLIQKDQIKSHLTASPKLPPIKLELDEIQPKQNQPEEIEPEFNDLKIEFDEHFSVADSSFDSQLDPFDSPSKNIYETMNFEDITPANKKIVARNVFSDDDDNIFAKIKNTNLNSTLLSGNPLTVRRPTQREDSTDYYPLMSLPQSSSHQINQIKLKVNGANGADELKLDDNSFDDAANQKLYDRMLSLNVNHYFNNRPGYSVKFLMSPTNSEQNNQLNFQIDQHTSADKALNGSVSHVKHHSQVLHPDKKSNVKTIKVLPELNGLYAMIGRKMDFSSGRKVWEISSLHEGKISKLYKNRHKAIVDFHKKFLTRIYPMGSRIDSSNYSPTMAWATGSQLVALNFQTNDEPMLLNYAKFIANGNTGYVLKPRYLRHNTLQDQDLSCYPRHMKRPIKKLTVRVISGQQIRPDNYKSSEIIDPYVEVRIHGLELDEQNNSNHRTQTIKDNGFHPYWGAKENANIFEFNLCAPDFCTLVFQIFDEDMVGRDKIGWYPIEFNNIQQGYRVVPVLNARMQPIKHSYIFCHISIANL